MFLRAHFLWLSPQVTFHEGAHNAFVTLPLSTRAGKGQARQREQRYVSQSRWAAASLPNTLVAHFIPTKR